MNIDESRWDVNCLECGSIATPVIGSNTPRKMPDGYIFSEQECGFECPICSHYFMRTNISICEPKEDEESCQE